MNKLKEVGIADAIYQKVKALPPGEQTEVLHYVDYVLFRASQEDALWMAQSIRTALRGLEDEDWPDYGIDDLQEQWACEDQAR